MAVLANETKALPTCDLVVIVDCCCGVIDILMHVNNSRVMSTAFHLVVSTHDQSSILDALQVQLKLFINNLSAAFFANQSSYNACIVFLPKPVTAYFMASVQDFVTALLTEELPTYLNIT